AAAVAHHHGPREQFEHVGPYERLHPAPDGRCGCGTRNCRRQLARSAGHRAAFVDPGKKVATTAPMERPWPVASERAGTRIARTQRRSEGAGLPVTTPPKYPGMPPPGRGFKELSPRYRGRTSVIS